MQISWYGIRKVFWSVSKKQYVRQIIEWSLDPTIQDKTFEQIEKIVNTKLALQMDMAEQAETYA
ncbi:MAG: hypothetical protein U1E91_05815 [Moraxella sp.]